MAQFPVSEQITGILTSSSKPLVLADNKNENKNNKNKTKTKYTYIICGAYNERQEAGPAGIAFAHGQ